MKNYKGKKFVASYSCGKDSTLAIYRAVKMGMVPMELITTYNKDKKQSWFHGVPKPLLDRISDAVGIPVTLIETTGEMYKENFEAKLISAREQGAEVCVFGDIDLEEHLVWCTERCKAAGLEAFFPLWKEERKNIVYEFIDSGFKTIITVVNNSRMTDKFIGNVLTREVAEEIEKSGADICGENGEYHTFAYDGPLFSNPVSFTIGEKIYHDNYTILPVS